MVTTLKEDDVETELNIQHCASGCIGRMSCYGMLCFPAVMETGHAFLSVHSDLYGYTQHYTAPR